MQTYFKYILSSIFKLKIPAKRAGFTLVELIVVMSIATVVMTTLVIQQSKWNDHLAVNVQTYELALMIRQAQVYSLGVREDMAGSGDKFNVGYGVYFNTNLVDANNKMNKYIFFVDRNNNKQYDSGEELEIKSFTRGVIIDQFCGFNPGGQEKCNRNSSNATILFFRPETKANITLTGMQAASTGPPIIIYLQSQNGKISSVTVESNGQVSIQQ